MTRKQADHSADESLEQTDLPSSDQDKVMKNKPSENPNPDTEPAGDEDVQELTRQRDDALGRYQRALADFQNYQRRSITNEQMARIRAKADLVRELLPALENMDIICSQDAGQTNAKALQQGMQMVRSEIHKALAAHGATRIEAQAGDEFDPNRHEAMMQVATDDVDPDHVANQIQVGYMIGDLVVRPAKVAVAKATQSAAQE